MIISVEVRYELVEVECLHSKVIISWVEVNATHTHTIPARSRGLGSWGLGVGVAPA